MMMGPPDSQVCSQQLTPNSIMMKNLESKAVDLASSIEKGIINDMSNLLLVKEEQLKAGSTLARNRKDLKAFDCSWNECDPAKFSLRIGPDYSRNKMKAPSPPSILEVVGIDFLKSDKRIDNIGSKVALPSEWTNYSSPEKLATFGVPPLLIFNFQFPADVNSSWWSLLGSCPTDGPGFSVVIYMKLAAHSETSLMSENPMDASGATKLLIEFLHSFEQTSTGSSSMPDKFQSRLKLILDCQNISSFGLPSFITGYNAKPVLMRNTIEFIHGANYNEIDINIHKFGNLGKQALQVLYGRIDMMTVNFGLVLESREDESMPETLIGCITMNKIDVKKAVSFAECTTTATVIADSTATL